MNDFNDRTEAYGALPLVVEQFRGKEEQRRADSLAAASPKIFANLGDGLNARDGVAAELALQCDEIVPQQVEYFFPVDGRRRAHTL